MSKYYFSISLKSKLDDVFVISRQLYVS